MSRKSDPSKEPKYRFYGRRKGRPLLSERKQAFEHVMETFVIPCEGVDKQDFSKVFKHPSDKYWLEIGFGAGEHLAAQAKMHPDINMIGCEPFLNGVSSLAKHITDDALENIRIWPDDARILIDTIPDHALDRIFLLHPDPWHKKRHHKRRFLQTTTLDMFARMLSPGGELRIATDDAELCDWMLEKTWKHPHFKWTAQSTDDWRKRPDDWPATRYGQKQLAGIPVYLIFKRV